MTQNSRPAQPGTAISLPSDREIVITRTFNAPRELVFRAHTDPVLIPLWWGPRSTTTIVEQMDVRPGGAWRFVHRTDDGQEFRFYGEFREVVPPERLVQTSEFDGAPGHVVLETITFEEHEGRTTMMIVDLFESMQDRDAALQSGMESGMVESHDRLSDLVVRMGPEGPRELVITRHFDAPRALVWKAWSEPEYVKRWWGPQHFTSPVCQIDFRVGGRYLFSMRSPEGQEFYSTGVYQKIEPMDEIVYTDSFADANGNVISPSEVGMNDVPLESPVTVRFEDQGSGTKLTVIAHRPTGVMGEYAYLGWNESLDKLAEILK